jgi:hypothetical protein
MDGERWAEKSIVTAPQRWLIARRRHGCVTKRGGKWLC